MVRRKSGTLVAVLFAGLSVPFTGAVAAAVDPTPSVTPPAETTAADHGVTKMQGRAYEGRRRPVVGAAVTVRDDGEAGVLVLTSTDARGQLRIQDVPDGRYTVSFRKEGYATVSKDRVEVRSPLRPVIEVPMVAAAGAGDAVARATGAIVAPVPTTIAGRVVDVTGAAVPDVRLRLVRTDGEFDPRTARTGPGGRFAIDDLHAGAWNVEVYGVGFLTIRCPVVVDRPLDVTVRLVPQPADFLASALDLMPLEIPVAPPGLEAAAAAVEPAALR